MMGSPELRRSPRKVAQDGFLLCLQADVELLGGHTAKGRPLHLTWF